MIRAVIADDEELSRRAMQQLLERHSDVEIVAACRDGAEAREAIRKLRPDVALLDIRMPVESGLDVARARNRGDTLVVFVTAFDRFALPAFEADAVDYLTKPIAEARFDAMLDRVRERVATRQGARRFAALKTDEDAGRYLARLVTRVGMVDTIIPLDTIDYIQACDVYASVICGPRRFLVRIALQALERALDPALFLRIHRSCLVRRDRITAVRRESGGTVKVILVGGIALPVSRRQRPGVARLFDSDGR